MLASFKLVEIVGRDFLDSYHLNRVCSRTLLNNPRSPRRLRKGVTNNFRKRKNTFVEKADELWTEFDCNVYVLLRRNGQLFNYTSRYTSRDGPSWLSLIEVVRGNLFNPRHII
jgi:hypothetical protein